MTFSKAVLHFANFSDRACTVSRGRKGAFREGLDQRACSRAHPSDLERGSLKALLKLTFVSGFAAAAIAITVAVQSVATYSSVAPITPPQKANPKPAFVPSTHIYGVAIDQNAGTATIRMTPFTPRNVAVALGHQFGMQLIGDWPSFGQYLFTLPAIRVGPGPQQHTVTVYFPPYATRSDIDRYLQANGLTVASWLSTDDASGRVAVASLPEVKPVLVDPQNGIWRAVVAVGIQLSQLEAWAKQNSVQIISYDQLTGVVMIQGPRPRPVPVRVVVHKPVPQTTTSTPQTTKLYIAFKDGTTFSQAQQEIQAAGGQITNFNSSNETGIATVPAGQASHAIASLTAAAQVGCVSSSSTACPSQVTASSTNTGGGSNTSGATTGTATTDTTTTPPT